MKTDELEERQLRAARNQSLFREVNEQVERLTEQLRPVLGDPNFVCECAQTECIAEITMSLAEYEELRRIPNRFAVRPGHVYPDVERVVEEHGPRFVVVEKIGAAGVEAVARDPRASLA